MNREERIRTGSRNRQFRLIAEFWILIVPVTAIAIALLLPVIHWLRTLYRGG